MDHVTTASGYLTASSVPRDGHVTHLELWTWKHEQVAVGIPYNLDDFSKAYKESKKHGL
jgi:hypothetical protein